MAEKPVLGYWRIRGRGDPARILLKHLDVDFEDRRYGDAEDLPTWSDEKPNLGMPFPNLPYFKDGDVAHSESIPIMRSICRKYKPEYMGRNEAEAGRADAYTPNLNDFLAKVAFPAFMPEDYLDKMEEGKAAMAQWLTDFEGVLGDNPFIAGEGPTYADFQISFCFVLIENYDAATLAANAKATAYWERFKALHNVAAALEAEGKGQLLPGFSGWQKDHMPAQLNSIQMNYPFTSRITKLANSCSVDSLCSLATRLYIGSLYLPKSREGADQIMKYAVDISKSHDELSQSTYYRETFARLTAIESGDNKAFSEASKQLVELSRQQYLPAMFTAGQELIKTWSSTQNQKSKPEFAVAARDNIVKCAELEYEPAFYYMGRLYEHGIGVSQDKNEALNWYRKSAETEDPQAMFKLSMLIPDQRKVWLKRSAELGLPEAQHNLAHEYKQEGDTLRQMAWLIQAAQQNFYPSILNVAKVFATGNDEIQPNPAASFVWLETGRAIAKTPELDEIEKIATEQFLLMKIKQQEVKLPAKDQKEIKEAASAAGHTPAEPSKSDESTNSEKK